MGEGDSNPLRTEGFGWTLDTDRGEQLRCHGAQCVCRFRAVLLVTPLHRQGHACFVTGDLSRGSPAGHICSLTSSCVVTTDC